jgi:HEAT repeat protein
VADSKKAVDTLIDLVKSTTTPNAVRAGAAAGLGFAGGSAARSTLIDIAKSTTTPIEVRSAAATALGYATKTE